MKYRVPEYVQTLSDEQFVVHHHPFPDGQVPQMAMLLKMLDQLRVNSMQGRKSLVQYVN